MRSGANPILSRWNSGGQESNAFSKGARLHQPRTPVQPPLCLSPLQPSSPACTVP